MLMRIHKFETVPIIIVVRYLNSWAYGITARPIGRTKPSSIVYLNISSTGRTKYNEIPTSNAKPYRNDKYFIIGRIYCFSNENFKYIPSSNKASGIFALDMIVATSKSTDGSWIWPKFRALITMYVIKGMDLPNFIRMARPSSFIPF